MSSHLPADVDAAADRAAVRRVTGSRRAVRPGAPGTDPTPQDHVAPVKATEDTDAPWGASGSSGNDDQLKRDVPPHWG